MRYVSLFSGVEAATVAWSRLGWEPLAFAEVDEFPAAVLAHRFPGVPNLGDVCDIDWEEFHERHGAVDVLIGGSPCQSFSIAGGRAGLEGESRLMFEYIRAARELVRASGGGSPRYILWENVPGCLSSNKGRDFGCLLDELEDCGYFVAWRTLDSQFTRVLDRAGGRLYGPVPQRRRRVFLVGSLGGPGACDILFERSCLLGDHPKGREARQALAEDAPGCPGVGGVAGFKYHQGSGVGNIGCGEVLPTIATDYHAPAVHYGFCPGVSATGSMTIDEELSPTVRAGANLTTPGVVSLTTANTNANGCNYNEDGARYTLDLTNSNAVAFEQNQRGEVRLNGGDGSLAGALSSNPAQTKGQGASLVCMETGQSRAVVSQDGTATTLNASHEQPIVCAADDNGKTAIEEDMCGALKVGGGRPE